jgi:hypothetical protein
MSDPERSAKTIMEKYTKMALLRLAGSIFVYAFLAYSVSLSENAESRRLLCALSIAVCLLSRRITNAVMDGELNSLKLDILTTGRGQDEVARYIDCSAIYLVGDGIAAAALVAFSICKYFF